MKFILYNPLSGNGESQKMAEGFAEKNEDCRLIDITKISDFSEFAGELSENDQVYLFGGDGTINRFINAMGEDAPVFDIFYFPSGTGNDFCIDIGKEKTDQPFLMNGYIKNLPKVCVNEKEYKFINGVGFGIDGYCCEVGDAVKAAGKTPNYTAIATKGLLFGFKPRNATVTVDGVNKEYKKVWIAPTMFGKHYGGGMMPTPDQDRSSDKVSLMLFHGSGKLKTLCIFPSIFKGKHVLKTKYVTVLEGKDITVRFDRPTPLQIDGETIPRVTEYTVNAKIKEKTTV